MPPRVGALVAEHQPGGAQPALDVGGVGGHDAEQRLHGRGGKAGDLDLATGFDGEHRAVGQPAVRTVRDQGARSVRAECGYQRRGVERSARIVGMVNGPFEFDAEQSRRAVLEAH